MMRLIEIEPEALDIYVEKEHAEANFLQTSSWGKVYEKDGKKVFYFGLFEDKKMIGSSVVILKPAKRGRYLEIPGGPLLNWDGDMKVLRFFMKEIAKIAEREKCVFVRMRPNIPDTDKNRKIAERLKLVKSPMHLHAEHTVMLDITKSEEDLMTEMRRQTRYEVRRAQKLGIKVSYETSDKAFNDFYDLQLQTAERQGFIPSSRHMILSQHEVFGEKARIYTASLDGKVLAQGEVLMQAPEAIYHEAASTLDGRKLPGAYALQWQIIQDAKAMGLKRYNLFGIAPPNSPNHRYAGVTTFKTGFGGEQVAYLSAHDLVIKPMHYKLVHALETIRKKRRHL
ncbi:MAG: aminoacyltransferase [Candidatus Saccharibacteria bacterium]|nr:aminoacyltransferase [Candidatus Saccharibacteria bacterium]